MKTVNFNLRTLQAKDETSILLVVHYQGKRLRMSTKERVLVQAWDREKQNNAYIQVTKQKLHAVSTNA